MARELRPSSIAPPAAAYAHAVLVDAPSRLLFTSGVVPIRPDGTVPDSIEDQAATVWKNAMAMLAEVGWGPSNVVSVTTYVVAGEALGPVMAARDRALQGHRAASTLVTVPMLARSEWRMEIAVVASG